MENWKPIKGYEGSYAVSDIGRIKSFYFSKPRILTSFKNRQGYMRINLMRNSNLKQMFVHRLVAQSFIGDVEQGMCVNHIDGNKSNNRLQNLEIITYKENSRHAVNVLKVHLKPVFMLDKDNYEVIREFNSITEASGMMNISDSSITRVCKNERNEAGGYSWAYKSDYSDKKIKKKIQRKISGKRRVKIKQIDPLTGKILGIYNGLRIAERETGIKGISQCTTGRTKTTGGYFWELIK